MCCTFSTTSCSSFSSAQWHWGVRPDEMSDHTGPLVVMIAKQDLSAEMVGLL